MNLPSSLLNVSGTRRKFDPTLFSHNMKNLSLSATRSFVTVRVSRDSNVSVTRTFSKISFCDTKFGFKCFFDTSTVRNSGCLTFYSSFYWSTPCCFCFGSWRYYVSVLSVICTSYCALGLLIMKLRAWSLSRLVCGSIVIVYRVLLTKWVILSHTSLSIVVRHKTRSSGFNYLNLK